MSHVPEERYQSARQRHTSKVQCRPWDPPSSRSKIDIFTFPSQRAESAGVLSGAQHHHSLTSACQTRQPTTDDDHHSQCCGFNAAYSHTRTQETPPAVIKYTAQHCHHWVSKDPPNHKIQGWRTPLCLLLSSTGQHGTQSMMQPDHMIHCCS